MPVLPHHSTSFDKAPSPEAIDTTSSQIFLSRGVADPGSEHSARSQSSHSSSVSSILESSSNFVVAVGEAPRPSTVVGSHRKQSMTDETMYDLCDSFVQSRTSRLFPSADGDSPSPFDKARQHSTNRTLIAGCHFTEEPECTSSKEGLDVSTTVDKDTGKEFERGRTLVMAPRFGNPLPRAESRPRRQNSAIDVDARSILKRHSRSSTFFENPSDPCAVLEDKLLEPCPHLSVCCSFSDVFSSPDDTSMAALLRPRSKMSSIMRTGYSSIERSSLPLTSLFSNCQLRSPSPTIPLAALSWAQPNVGRLKGIASSPSLQEKTPSSSAEERNILKLRPPQAAGLPTEILQQIFYNLHPSDFNSARRTCRSWFINSLDRSVLETMLRRGGWSSIIPRRVSSNRVRDAGDTINHEWHMSKRISRECALGPDWTGNGLCGNSGKSSGSLSKSAFVHISTTDFTDVAVHYPGLRSSGTIFTVSCCGRFLMAANGCLIYIYELNKSHRPLDSSTSSNTGSLRPVTSILCPRRVLACSMDTSSHRYAIAVLLDGRMGLVCDISPSNVAASSYSRTRFDQSEISKFPESSESSRQSCEAESSCNGGASFLDRVRLNSPSSNLGSNQASSEPPFIFPRIVTSRSLDTALLSDESCWSHASHRYSPETVRTGGPSSQHPLSMAQSTTTTQNFSPSLLDKDSGATFMPIENGPRSLYRNLCSDDDPPRSVAICPQRRCVAFGCSAGIELHWIDALTGQDLNRWFPLTAPSDYLFFLPPRKSIDSAKKLRLISSAARPGERAAITERSFGGRAKNSPFWEERGWGAGKMEDEDVTDQSQGLISRLTNEVRSRGSSGRMDYFDHYCAIPVSDGYHILFTDPSTGLLCLGSDAPVGGPTKLLRKIWFQGPEGEGSPVAYASGSDLRFGVRVVAAFGSGANQRIWFFSVPSDVFAANNQTTIRGSWLKSSTNCQNKNIEWMKWWPDNGLQEWISYAQDAVPGIIPRSAWPVKIKGQEIGTLPGLVDLAIDSGPIMTVWGFSSDGVAKVWQIDDGNFDGTASKRLVARDGTLREVDGEGNVEMSDAPDVAVSPLPFQSESFDGTASLIASTSRRERYHDIHGNELEIKGVAEGDILMDSLRYSGIFGSDSSLGFRDEATLAQASEIVYETFQRSENVYFAGMADIVEDLTGVARIDVEIH